MRSESVRVRVCAASLCLVLAASAAHAMTHFAVARTADDEAYPTVWGDVVVWQFYNSRYDDWDIRGADVSDPASPANFMISDIPGDDWFPVVDGNDVVWQHHYRPDSDGDVYGADISDRPGVRRYAISASLDDECLPWVSDGVVVWQHRFSGVPDWDILGARLTGREYPPPFHISTSIDIDELFPCISGKLVVWNQQPLDGSQPCAWGADVSDPNNPRSFYTNLAMGVEQMPGLSEGWIVWRETDDIGRVMVDNLYDPFNPEGIGSSGLTACPRVHKHIVVWQDKSNGTWDIRAYNLITRREFVVTDRKMSDQVNPAVYVDLQRKRAVIVWQDNRDGNWDIYAAVLDGDELATEPGGQ